MEAAGLLKRRDDLSDGRLVRVWLRLPLGRIAESHEAVEGGRAGGHVVIDVG